MGAGRKPNLVPLRDEIRRLGEQVVVLKAALKPFAKLAAPLVDHRANIAIGLTDADFVRAREAYGDEDGTGRTDNG